MPKLLISTLWKQEQILLGCHSFCRFLTINHKFNVQYVRIGCLKVILNTNINRGQHITRVTIECC